MNPSFRFFDVMSGYLMAFFTALRRAELEGLTWGDVHLDAEKPFFVVRASTTKNHKSAEIRLHPQLVRKMIKHRPADASGNDPLLKREQLANMDEMRKDLKLADIPFLDTQGIREVLSEERLSRSLRRIFKVRSLPRGLERVRVLFSREPHQLTQRRPVMPSK